MTCDELELRLPEVGEDPEAQAHLAGCARCRQTAALLSAVAQPAVSAAEKAKLVGLASAVQTRWVGLEQRRGRGQRLVSLALAASLGAVVASGVMWKLNQPQPRVVVEPGVEAELAVGWEEATPPAADDERSFEMWWPSLNDEGDVL